MRNPIIYNKSKKVEFVDSLPLKQESKKAYWTVFGNTGAFESGSEKDLVDFTDEEVIELLYNIPVLQQRDKQQYYNTINKYKTFCGVSPVESITEQDYKKGYIDRAQINNIPWVLDDESLLKLIIKKCDVSDKTYNMYKAGYMKPLALYKLLKFYGLSDEDISKIKRDEFLKSFVLPNDRLITSPIIKELIIDICNMDWFIIRKNDGRVIRMDFCDSPYLIRPWTYHNYDNSAVIKNYDGDDYVKYIKTLGVKFTKAISGVPQLTAANIDEAGKFNALYVQDILNNNNANIELSYEHIRTSAINVNGKKVSPQHKLSIIDEEKYNIYKAIRLKMIGVGVK